MLSLVSADLHDRGGTVIVQGATQDEVTSTAARQLAIKTAAAQGISRPGTGGNESCYPVDEQGETSEDLIFARGGKRVAAYRCDFQITGGI